MSNRLPLILSCKRCHQPFPRETRGEGLGRLCLDCQSQSTCVSQGCGRLIVSHHLCASHAEQWRRGIPLSPIGSYRRRSDVGHLSRGYRYFGKIAEHRLVMERLVGRPLTTLESVHHKNTVRDDNRPDNLELWTKSQPAGGRVVDKVLWALELLDEYATFIPQARLMRRQEGN